MHIKIALKSRKSLIVSLHGCKATKISDFLNHLHNKHIRSGFDDKLQRQHGQLYHHQPRQFRHHNSEHSRGLIKCHFRATIPSGNLQCYCHRDDSGTKIQFGKWTTYDDYYRQWCNCTIYTDIKILKNLASLLAFLFGIRFCSLNETLASAKIGDSWDRLRDYFMNCCAKSCATE